MKNLYRYNKTWKIQSPKRCYKKDELATLIWHRMDKGDFFAITTYIYNGKICLVYLNVAEKDTFDSFQTKKNTK